MPNTPNRTLPFPDDEEWLAQGAYAIEQLARRVDTILDTVAGGALVIAPDGTNVAGGTAPGVIPFAGAVATADDWTWDGSRATYTGAPRTFMVAVEVVTNVENAGGASTTVELRANGAAFAGSYDNVQRPEGGVVRRDVTHRITVPVGLNAGDWLDVTGVGSVAYQIDATALRIYPLGPSA